MSPPCFAAFQYRRGDSQKVDDHTIKWGVYQHTGKIPSFKLYISMASGGSLSSVDILNVNCPNEIKKEMNIEEAFSRFTQTKDYQVGDLTEPKVANTDSPQRPCLQPSIKMRQRDNGDSDILVENQWLTKHNESIDRRVNGFLCDGEDVYDSSVDQKEASGSAGKPPAINVQKDSSFLASHVDLQNRNCTKEDNKTTMLGEENGTSDTYSCTSPKEIFDNGLVENGDKTDTNHNVDGTPMTAQTNNHEDACGSRDLQQTSCSQLALDLLQGCNGGSKTYQGQVIVTDPSKRTFDIKDGATVQIDQAREVVVKEKATVKDSSAILLGKNNLLCLPSSSRDTDISSTAASEPPLQTNSRELHSPISNVRIGNVDKVVVLRDIEFDSCNGIQIGDENVAKVVNREDSTDSNPDFVNACIDLDMDDRDEDDIFEKLGDVDRLREFSRRMASRGGANVEIEGATRGCILLKMKVPTEEDRLRLIQMVKDGTFKEVFLETFLPDYAKRGKNVRVNLAIAITNPSQKVVDEMHGASASDGTRDVVVVEVNGPPTTPGSSGTSSPLPLSASPGETDGKGASQSGSDMDSNGAQQVTLPKTPDIHQSEGQRFRNFLISHLDAEDIPGVQWTNRSTGLFRIRWRLATATDYDPDKDEVIFKLWAQSTGRWKPGDPEDPTMWRADMHEALRRFAMLEDEPDDGKANDLQEQLRLYKLNPHPRDDAVSPSNGGHKRLHGQSITTKQQDEAAGGYQLAQPLEMWEDFEQTERGPSNIKGGHNRILTSPHNQAPRDINLGESTYQEHLQEGDMALQTGDLDRAEVNFAAALKSVFVKDEHWKETEPLLKLSYVYLKRGVQSKDGGDYTKAAALCNAALVRASTRDRDGIKQTILSIARSFVKYVLNIEQKVDMDNAQKHKFILREYRDYVKQELKRIEEEVDPYSLDDADPKIREVEKKRAEEIKALFQKIGEQRKMFLASLVDECMGVMGPPPCKYAMVGLGSQAIGLVTPYSELEFAILVERETQFDVEYFRNLTHYLHHKVIDLGETILPAMGIKSLNDFSSDDPLDNWFYDSVTPRGFSFDGAMPHACKTPLGRGEAHELIHTPRTMATVLKDYLTSHLRKGYHLDSIIGNACFLTGELGLTDAYTALWTQQLQETDSKTSLAIAKAIGQNAQTFQIQSLTGSLLNVKREIYRFSNLAVTCLALLHDIEPTTVWDTIQMLNKKGVINSENAHHLMVLVSISAELRLRTYMHNHGQVENMSALSAVSTVVDIEEPLRNVFYISNTKQLMRYYYTAKPLKCLLSQFCDRRPPNEPFILFDNSSQLKTDEYESRGDCRKSTTSTEWALDITNRFEYVDVDIDIIHPLNRIGIATIKLSDHREAVSHYERSLQLFRDLYGENTARPGIAASLNNLGIAWSCLDDYGKAISYYEQSLQMERSIYGEDTAHIDIAGSLNNLGSAWRDLGDGMKANSYFVEALKMTRGIYGEEIAHPDIAAMLDNLGDTLGHLGDHRRALKYYEVSLQLKRSIYGKTTAHPDISKSLNNLGKASLDLGDHERADSYYRQSLQMTREIEGQSTAHRDIAKLLYNLGVTCTDLGDYGKAVEYYEQYVATNECLWQGQ
ncbi:uncharacterized protein LOC144888036 isoform X2 [Branchiostoma floridae x Branchiostoma japonicum]